jgi:putative phage-type endonuclease
MERQEWLERRRKGIGGTDAAAILGLSKYRTAVDVWEDKTGRTPIDGTISAPMKWGLLLEDVVARAYMEETGRTVQRVPGARKHPRLSFIIGSPDRIVRAGAAGPSKLLEIKTARSSDDYAPKGSELTVDPVKRIPPAHYVQVQHYLGITGLDTADVAVLFGGSDFRIYEIPADPDFIVDLYAELGLWWNEYVLEDVQPPVGPDDGAYLARKYPRSEDEETVATSEIAVAVAELLEVRDRIDGLERGRDGLENTIKEYMGTAARLLAPAGSITWKANDRRAVDWKGYTTTLENVLAALRRRHESIEGAVDDEMLEEYGTTRIAEAREGYTQTTTVRPFRITRSKEKAS